MPHKKLSVGLCLAALVVSMPAWRSATATLAKSPVALPKGTIVAWSPPAGVTAPPAGWLLCDRTNHETYGWVPELSERFLWGAGQPFPAADAGLESDLGHRGGSLTHQHLGSRTPRTVVRSERAQRQSLGRELADASHQHAVEVSSDRHLPPFHKVAFIIKAD